MDVIFRKASEPERWTVVFHRKAANRFFSAIAMGHFKHVSAFAWVPDVGVWVVYDVTFRRTRLVLLPDTPESKAIIGEIITGNCMVTLKARHDAFPVARFGLYCTTAIKHLLGLRGGALRPDALFRLCVREGGEVSDDECPENRPANRSEPGGRTAAGAAG